MPDLEISMPRTKEQVEFDAAGLGKLIEAAYLTRNREPHDRSRKTFPPSGIGYGSGTCARRWFYEFNTPAVREDDTNAFQQSNMMWGTERHERLQELFEKTDILIETEREILSDDPPIRGFVDLIVEWGGITVGEIKTIKQEAFTLLRASGKPRGYQLIQLLIYMNILEIDRGFFLYENKNTGELLILPVFMDEENRSIIDNAFDWMRESFKNEELPTRPFDSKSSMACKTCPFKKFCWQDADGTRDMPLLEVPE